MTFMTGAGDFAANVVVLAAVALASTSAAAGTLKGKVVYVDDGDTVVLLVEGNRKVKVRLASIDAPESSHTRKERGRIGQPFSEGSKRFLADMVKSKNVEGVCPDIDRANQNGKQAVDQASFGIDQVAGALRRLGAAPSSF